MVAWVSWGLVLLGIAFVVAAVMSLGERLRPLRRALRRLSWRREELARLQAGAEALEARLGDLTAQAAIARVPTSEPARNSEPARG